MQHKNSRVRESARETGNRVRHALITDSTQLNLTLVERMIRVVLRTARMSHDIAGHPRSIMSRVEPSATFLMKTASNRPPPIFQMTKPFISSLAYLRFKANF